MCVVCVVCVCMYVVRMLCVCSVCIVVYSINIAFLTWNLLKFRIVSKLLQIYL